MLQTWASDDHVMSHDHVTWVSRETVFNFKLTTIDLSSRGGYYMKRLLLELKYFSWVD